LPIAFLGAVGASVSGSFGGVGGRVRSMTCDMGGCCGVTSSTGRIASRLMIGIVIGGCSFGCCSSK